MPSSAGGSILQGATNPKCLTKFSTLQDSVYGIKRLNSRAAALILQASQCARLAPEDPLVNKQIFTPQREPGSFKALQPTKCMRSCPKDEDTCIKDAGPKFAIPKVEGENLDIALLRSRKALIVVLGMQPPTSLHMHPQDTAVWSTGGSVETSSILQESNARVTTQHGGSAWAWTGHCGGA
eukprot:TRINITY_DN3670_c0_g1_i1.p1 TRINITY_DN3670_c0_g1~~TRINITY_DN3670_c0_g1_i1.p1  ORF type:complete len:181 (+),score=2.43 TRINITY_DN3670_c0_g1_i1:194-736(+)